MFRIVGFAYGCMGAVVPVPPTDAPINDSVTVPPSVAPPDSHLRPEEILGTLLDIIPLYDPEQYHWIPDGNQAILPTIHSNGKVSVVKSQIPVDKQAMDQIAWFIQYMTRNIEFVDTPDGGYWRLPNIFAFSRATLRRSEYMKKHHLENDFYDTEDGNQSDHDVFNREKKLDPSVTVEMLDEAVRLAKLQKPISRRQYKFPPQVDAVFGMVDSNATNKLHPWESNKGNLEHEWYNTNQRLPDFPHFD